MNTPGSILLVDHSRVSLMFQETVLKRSDNLVVSASSGGEAWERIRSDRPALVIFGYDLADMTGPELCRQVRSDDEAKKTSLLFITDRHGEQHADLCLAAGCNDILYRPFHRRELDLKVAKLLAIPVRRELRTLTKLQVSIQNEEFYLLGHSVNVSANGMLVQVEHLLPPEATVRISFYLPGDANPLQLEAAVVRAEFSGGSPRYGIQFMDLPAEFRERIDHFVRRARSREHQ